MPADLDTMIRGLVRELVEHAPPAPDLDLHAAPPRHRGRAGVAIALGVVAAIVVAIVTVGIVDQTDTLEPGRAGGSTVTLPLDSVPPGVSARGLHGVAAFLERDGREITTFVADPQHITGVTRIVWCSREGVFFAPRFGEKFDRSGRAIGGPAPRGLDRLATRVDRDQVTIRLDDVIHDDRSRGSGPEPSAGEFCTHRVAVGGGSGPVTLPVESIPHGVSYGLVGNTRTFVVRDEMRVDVFIVSAQHLKGENSLWWCPNEQIFISPTHAERFDKLGRYVDGPARRGLDRFRTRVRDGLVTIERRRVLGALRTTAPGLPFPECDGRLVSGP